MPGKTVKLKTLFAACWKTNIYVTFCCAGDNMSISCQHWKKCIKNLLIVCYVTPLELFSKIVHFVSLRLRRFVTRFISLLE